MKNIVVETLHHGPVVVEYDEQAPCRCCGQPVIEASMGGTDVCPWCDSGYNRDGTKWSYGDFKRAMKTYPELKYSATGGHPP